jgi:hypothetical protein
MLMGVREMHSPPKGPRTLDVSPFSVRGLCARVFLFFEHKAPSARRESSARVLLRLGKGEAWYQIKPFRMALETASVWVRT